MTDNTPPINTDKQATAKTTSVADQAADVFNAAPAKHKTAKPSKSTASKTSTKPPQRTATKTVRKTHAKNQPKISRTIKKSPLKDTTKDTKTQTIPADWPLEADRLSQKHPLLESVVILAHHYGRRTSLETLSSGLPVSRNKITPAHIIRACERTHLTAKLVSRPLKTLKKIQNLPCLLVLSDGMACILWKANATHATIQFPETPDEKTTLAHEDLMELYTGQAFFIRPIARALDRVGPAHIETGRNWFWGVLKENNAVYSEILIASIMINTFGLVSSLFVMTVYDRVVPNNALETLWTLTAGVVIVYLFDFLTKTLRSQFLEWAGKKADVKISASLFEQILGMTMAARPSSAGVLASKMREFETIRDFFTSATITSLIDVPFILLYVAFIGIIGGPLAFIPLIAIPLILIVSLTLQKKLDAIIADSLNESALKNALLFETFTGLETIKVQAAESYTQRNWEELSEKSSKTAMESKKIAVFAQNWATLVQQMVNVWIVVFGVYLIHDAQLSMGGLIACVILSGRAMAPLAQISGLITRISQTRQSLEHLDDMMRAPVERPANKHFISKDRIEGKIEFRNVSFAYPGQTIPAVNDASFSVNPGEKIGIIGAVGSGKTTVERLLLNLFPPESGSVQIDGTDVRQIEPADLRRNIGTVQQSPQLFYGSVRQNITMGHETASNSAILRAAEMAGVLEFLAESSAGLDTAVGERGESLSGGQRQAIAIARALLYDPPILIMDEPTAAMDPGSESRLRKRLRDIAKNKTTLLITHKGSMLPLVDKIILMDKGKIIAFGPRDEILKKLQNRQYGTK